MQYAFNGFANFWNFKLSFYVCISYFCLLFAALFHALLLQIALLMFTCIYIIIHRCLFILNSHRLTVTTTHGCNNVCGGVCSLLASGFQCK